MCIVQRTYPCRSPCFSTKVVSIVDTDCRSETFVEHISFLHVIYEIQREQDANKQRTIEITWFCPLLRDKDSIRVLFEQQTNDPMMMSIV
jgi:hypothetical protein